MTLDSAQLITDELIKEAAADEINIESMYNDLRSRFYTTPNRRILNLYVADHNAIAQHVVIDEASLKGATNLLKTYAFHFHQRR